MFPDQGLLGLPGSNFGNQCDGLTLGIGNASSEFLTGCPQLAEDIPICQAAGKKVFLSLGGDSTSSQIIESQTSAINFADFLWATFGPKSDKLTLLENSRPFGDAVVDGFDFDIEKNGGYGMFHPVLPCDLQSGLILNYPQAMQPWSIVSESTSQTNRPEPSISPEHRNVPFPTHN